MMYTPEQAAAIAQLHPETIVRMCRRGELRATKPAGRWRITARTSSGGCSIASHGTQGLGRPGAGPGVCRVDFATCWTRANERRTTPTG